MSTDPQREGSEGAEPVPERLPPEPEFSFNVGETEDSLPRMRELYARFGDIYRVYSPARHRYAYVINHPDDVKRVLVTHHANYAKGFGLDRVRLLVGNGLVTSDGDFWRSQRYMMQPMFHRRVVTRFGRIIEEANDQLLERWERQAAQGEPINVTDAVSELSLQIVLQAIFGEDLQRLSREPGGHPFHLITRDSARDLSFAYRFRQLRKLVGEIAERRRAETPPQAQGESSPASAQCDFIGMMVAVRDRATGAPMQEQALIDEVMTLIIAGHETTASTLNFVWYLLSQHPEVERRLHEEIDAAAEWREPSLADSESLPYARRVITEALRLYPPVWLFSRRSLGPDVLAGYPIPAGVDVLLSPYLIHRHPRFWSDPELFLPDRVEAVEEARRPRLAYLPFSAGPRHCIGESLALFEMSVHLYKVARRYRLTLPAGYPMELEASINLRSRAPLYMRLVGGGAPPPPPPAPPAIRSGGGAFRGRRAAATGG